MQKYLKSMLLITNLLLFNTSFAECNTDPELKLIKFPPSNLAAYLPKESVVEKNVYDYPEYSDIIYNVVYKDKPITVNMTSWMTTYLNDLLDFDYDKKVVLPNISDKANFEKRQCNDKTCALAFFWPVSDIGRGDYSTSIAYSLPMEEDHIGEAFMKSLFIDDYKCAAAEPDSIINHGPFEIRINFEPNSVIVLPQYYGDIAGFAKYVNENNVNIDIKAHADKTEIGNDGDDGEEYRLSLSERRLEAVKTLLIKQHGVDPAKLTRAGGYGSSQPRAASDTAEGQQMNRRVQADLYTNMKGIDE